MKLRANRWATLFSVLSLGVITMTGCEAERVETTPDGGTVEIESDGDREYTSPTGVETEVERDGDTLEIEQTPAPN